MKMKKAKYILCCGVLGVTLGMLGCNAGNSSGSDVMSTQAKSAQNGGDIGSFIAMSSSAIGKYYNDNTGKFLYAWVGYDGMFHRFVLNHYADSNGDVNMEPLSLVNLKISAPNVNVFNRVMYVMPSSQTGGSVYGRFIVIGDNGTLLMSTDNTASKFERINIPGDSSNLVLTHVIAQFDSSNNLELVVTGVRYDDSDGSEKNEMYYVIDPDNGVFPKSPSDLKINKLVINIQSDIYRAMKFLGNDVIVTDGKQLIKFKENSTTKEFDNQEVEVPSLNNGAGPVEDILVFTGSSGSSNILLLHKSGKVSLYSDKKISSMTFLPDQYKMYNDPDLGGVVNTASACQLGKGGACMVQTVNFYTGGEIGMPADAIQEIQKEAGKTGIKNYLLRNTILNFGGEIASLAIYPGTDKLYSAVGVDMQGMAFVSKTNSFPGDGDVTWEQLLSIAPGE